MSVDDRALDHLALQAAAALGPDAARTLMDHLAPADPDDRLVTRGDLSTFGDDLRTELRGEMADLRTELRGEMIDLRTELREEMVQLRLDVGEMFRDQTNRMITWLLIHLAAVTASVLTIVALFQQTG